jgi:hypothetical protein
MAQAQQKDNKKPRGRPVGTKGTKISKLRRIANRLEQMARTQGMEIIQQSLDGKDVDKEKLATAKWTVTTAAAIHKSCLQEEMDRAAAKGEDDIPDVSDFSVKNNVAQFSLVIPKKEEE